MRKILIVVGAVLMIFTACSEEKASIRLGTMPTYSASIYAVGIEKGFFESAGVTVELEVFRSARDRDGAATAGQLDGFMTDIIGAVNLNAKGFPYTMTSREYDAFGIVAGKDMDLSLIAVPMTGVAENTVVEYVADVYLKQEFQKVNLLSIPDRMGALLSGELDYGVFPQPFMDIVLGNGGQMVVNTVTEDFFPVVVVFDQTFLMENEKTVEAFYEGYKNTVAYMQASEFGDYKSALVTYGLATEDNVDTYRLPVDQYGLNSVDREDYEKIIAWMEEKDLLISKIDFEDISTDRFLKTEND